MCENLTSFNNGDELTSQKSPPKQQLQVRTPEIRVELLDNFQRDVVVVGVVSGSDEGHHHSCSSRGDEETGAEVFGKSRWNQLRSADGVRSDQR